MTTQTSPPPSVTATASTNGSSHHDLTTELLRLRERFDAYERLDQQLDEMVTGLTELLRGAAELRRRTNQDITSALARCETLIADDRLQQYQLLTSLQTELDAAHRRTSSLSQAIDAVQRQLADITDRLPGTNGTSQPDTTRSGPNSQAPARTATTTMQLTIRDVPGVATALTIQRAISEHPFVIAMQTREFAAGELRLHLELTEPLTAHHLPTLPTGTFAPVEAENDRLVVRYDALYPSTG
jgi:hypothetical protein